MRKHAFPVAIGTEIHFEEGASRVVGVFDDPYDGTTVELEDMPLPGATAAKSFSMPLTLLTSIVDAYDVVIVLPSLATELGVAA